MNVVDSSAWLEYFAGGRNAAFFSAAIEDPARLVVPAIVVFEVFNLKTAVNRWHRRADPGFR